MARFVDDFRTLQGRVMITKDGRVRYGGLVVASIAIRAVPALSNLIVNVVLRSRYPMPGACYSVNGRPMHLYC